MKDIITIYQIGEVIFCGKNITAKEIIDIMSDTQNTMLDYKIAPLESSYIIGSNSINTSGDIYVMTVNSIGKKENRRKKRFLDVFLSVFFLLFFVIIVWFVNRKRMFFRNIFLCFSGRKTWVGYCPSDDEDSQNSFPKLKKGVIFPTDALNLEQYNNEIIRQVNNLYARDYKIFGDLNIILKGFKHLGR